MFLSCYQYVAFLQDMRQERDFDNGLFSHDIIVDITLDLHKISLIDIYVK